MRVLAVPVKSLSRAKSRLAPLLSPLERAALTLAMLEDELDAAMAIPGWEVWVISPDEAALEISARRGARPVAEKTPPLRSALRQVETEALEREASALAVVLGDLPLLSAEALGQAVQTLGPVVAAPSRSDGGTNLLLRRPPRAIPARFGRDSLHKHVESARARGIPLSTVDREEIAFDLDLPEDISVVLSSGREGRTRQACLEMGLAERLGVRI